MLFYGVFCRDYIVFFSTELVVNVRFLPGNQVYVQAAKTDIATRVTVVTAGLDEWDDCYYKETMDIAAGEVAE